jgi:hypothetical protein
MSDPEEVRNPLFAGLDKERSSSSNAIRMKGIIDPKDTPEIPRSRSLSSGIGRARAGSAHSSDLASEKIQNVTPRTLHWATPDMLQHDVVLHDIEKKDLSESAKISAGRPRKMTTIAEEYSLGNQQPNRGRKYSTESMEELKEYLTSKGSHYRKLFNLLDATIPRLQSRISSYCIIFFLLCLSFLSQNLQYPASWFSLFFILTGIDIATSICDHAFFAYFIDKVFVNHFDIAYLLHSFNGPIGLLTTTFFAKSCFSDYQAVKSFPQWDRYVNAVVIILLFVCIKNWYSRKNYIALLERRFTEKLFQMETWSIILSEVASCKPPKTIKRVQFVPPNDPNMSSAKAQSPRQPPLQKQQSKILENLENFENDLANNGIGTIFSAVPGLDTVQKRVINVFTDLVEATAKYNDDLEDDVDLAVQIRKNMPKSSKSPFESSANIITSPSETRNLTSPSPSSANSIPASEKFKFTENLRTRLRKRKTFWDLAARVSTNTGSLKIITYNGPVVIRRKFQAKEFGQSLFLHLSRGNKYVITHSLFEELFHNSRFSKSYYETKYKNNNDNNNNIPKNRASTHHPLFNDTIIPTTKKKKNDHMTDYDRDLDGDIEMGAAKYESHLSRNYEKYTAIAAMSGNEDKDAETLLYETAIELFDPFNLGYVTEEQCMAAVCLVYKEYRYAATSLNDYGELHKSLRTVIDVVFWMFILVVLQTYLSFNFYSQYILPFVTMAFTISFALTPSLGQVLVATLFVFFMIPYEIGHKITIGVDANKITGWVRGITLLQTTVTTVKNETVSFFFRTGRDVS